MNLQIDNSGNAVQILRPIPGSGFSLDGTSAAVQSAALDAKCIRVCAITDINILFGANPTALTTSCFLPAGTVEYFKFYAGEKVSVLGGVANICIVN